MEQIYKSQIETLKHLFTTKGCFCFLDGRNEFGSHVLHGYPSNMPEDTFEDIYEQSERILKCAESHGLKIGEDAAWCVFSWIEHQVGEYGVIEVSGYWEFKYIDIDLTKIILEDEKKGKTNVSIS